MQCIYSGDSNSSLASQLAFILILLAVNIKLLPAVLCIYCCVSGGICYMYHVTTSVAVVCSIMSTQSRAIRC